jgi:acyl carrier protein
MGFDAQTREIFDILFNPRLRRYIKLPPEHSLKGLFGNAVEPSSWKRRTTGHQIASVRYHFGKVGQAGWRSICARPAGSAARIPPECRRPAEQMAKSMDVCRNWTHQAAFPLQRRRGTSSDRPPLWINRRERMLTRDEIAERCKVIIAEHLNCAPTKVTDQSLLFEDLEVDSLDGLGITADCEVEFKILVLDEEAEALTRVCDLIDLVEQKISPSGRETRSGRFNHLG